MSKTINRNSAEPLYDQVHEAIIAYIEQNHLKPNDLLPSERDFSERLKVSRLTVRRAIERLTQDGMVFRRPGKGTFVSLPKLEQRLLVLTSFTAAIQQEGHTPGTQLLSVEVEKQNAKICGYLEIDADVLVMKVRRLRFVDTLPFSLSTSYLPHDLTRSLEPRDFQSHSLYALLKEKCGLELAKSKVSVEATVARQSEAPLLKIKPGAPLFRMTGVLKTSTGRVAEYSNVLYRGDVLRFIAESD
jgi:GntR family transcriptional regulator